MFNPTPYVILDGTRLDCQVSSVNTVPVALDGIEIGWGRDDYISHARPATLSFNVLDRTGDMPARIAGKAIIGRPVELWWEHAATGATQRCFAGRITGAEAVKAGHRALTVGAADDGSGGVVLSFTAAARDADLGNVIMAPATWPRETMLTRANRIKAAAVPAKITDFFFYPGSVNINCWPLDVKGVALGQLTDDFYMSMGDTYSYHPHTNVVRHLYRRAYAAAIYLVQEPDALGLVYVQAGDIGYDGQTYKGIGLTGCEVVAEGGVNLAPNSVVTQVQVSWKNQPAGNADVVTIVQTPEGDANGRRTVTFTSWIDDGVHIDPMVAEVLARGQNEGALPKHPAVTFDTRPRGGFHSRGEAEGLTLAAETQGMAYLSASPYSAWLGDITPVFAIIGGTIRYADGWVTTATLQHIWKTNATAQVIWNDLHHPLLWKTNATGQLADSVTWHDFKFLTHPAVYAAS